MKTINRLLCNKDFFNLGITAQVFLESLSDSSVMDYAVSSCQVRISAIFHYLSIIHNYKAKFTKFLTLIILEKRTKHFLIML